MPRKRRPDPRQIDMGALFEPPAAGDDDGVLDFDARVRRLLKKAIKTSRKSRLEIAHEMTRAVYGAGDDAEGEITKAQLDSWTAASRADWRFPLSYLPAFVITTGAHWLMAELAKAVGGKYFVGQDVMLVELGRTVLQQKQANRRRRDIEAKVGADTFQEMMSRLEGDDQ